MKIVARSMILLVLCAATEFGVTGQALPHQVSEYNVVQVDERRPYHVDLEPQQEPGTVEVYAGCLTFLSEVRFSIALPFGKTVESVLPAGASWRVPSGRYKLDNPTKAPIEYVLKSGSPCDDSFKQ